MSLSKHNKKPTLVEQLKSHIGIFSFITGMVLLRTFGSIFSYLTEAGSMSIYLVVSNVLLSFYMLFLLLGISGDSHVATKLVNTRIATVLGCTIVSLSIFAKAANEESVVMRNIGIALLVIAFILILYHYYRTEYNAHNDEKSHK